MTSHVIQRAGRLRLAASLPALAFGLAVSGATAARAAGAVAPDQPSASISNGTLVVAGTDQADVVGLNLTTDQAALLVNLGGGLSQAFDLASFTAISVALGRGNDTFAVNEVTPLSAALTVEGGGGDDQLIGTAGDDTLAGGAGDDLLRGRDGADALAGNAGDDVVLGERGDDAVSLGGGADRAEWNPGDGNDDVVGGSGADSVGFHGSNADDEVTVSPTSDGHVVLGRDIAAVRLELDGIEDLSIAANGGADVITLNDVRGTDLSSEAVDLSAVGAGDGQLDSVILNGTSRPDALTVDGDATGVVVAGLRATGHVVGADLTDQLHVNAGAGDDEVAVMDAALARLDVRVDLGTGES